MWLKKAEKYKEGEWGLSYPVKKFYRYHFNSLKSHTDLWKCLSQTDKLDFQDMKATDLVIERPLDTWVISLRLFSLVFDFWVFCHDLPSLVRLGAVEACYSSQLKIHQHIHFQWYYWGVGPLPACLIHVYLPTLLPPQKKPQVLQTERISDMNSHILIALGEVSHIWSNVIFLPSINLKNLACVSGGLCCKIYLHSLQGEKIRKDCTWSDVWSSAESSQ